MKEDMILWIVGGIVLASVLSKGKVGEVVGENVGYATGSLVGGAGSGIIQGFTESTYGWASTYEGTIPILDPLAKAAAWYKNIGDPDKWFG